MKLKDCYKVLMLGAALPTYMLGSASAGNSENNPIEETQRIIVANDSIDSVQSYDMLDEFEITADAKIVTSDGHKLTYNADEDPAASGKSVLEMLRNVPMITVDGEDKIKVNGKEGVRIYVNGKEEPMLTSNASQILKAMPSAAVSKVEVIHEPGAKYDAEGNAGIINLITERKQKEDGYSGSLHGDFSNQTYALSGFGTVKKKNVTFSANINYADVSLSKQKTWSDESSTYLDTGNVMSSSSRQTVGFNYLGGGFNMSFEPNQSNLFTASANAYNVNIDIAEALMKNSLRNGSGNLLWEEEKHLGGDMKNMSFSGNAGYQHTFGRPNHTLIGSYKFDFGRNPISLYHKYINDSKEIFSDLSRMNQTNRQYNREHTLQLDYSLPLPGDAQTIEIGAKGIMRDNSSYSTTEIISKQDNIIDRDHDNFRQYQDIYAGYATYSISVRTKLNINAGIRYEHTKMGGEFRYKPENNFSSNLNDFVPNAGITYMFGPAKNLRMAYQMRISRPTLDQVNPFMMQTGNYNYRGGNPDLSSERSNILTVTYTEFGRLLGGNIGIELFQSDNMIESIDYFDGLIQYQTYANIGSKRSAYLTGFLNYQITKEMSVFANGRIGYNSIKADELKYKNHGWQGDINGGWTWSPSAIGQFSIYGGYSSSSPTLQGRRSGWYYYQASASREILKDKSLKFTVYARNFFQSSVGFKNITHTHNVDNITSYRVRNWAVGISVDWTFGNYKGKVKELSTSIENNDKSSVSTKGQGGF